MNIKTELIRVAVRAISEKTNIISTQDSLEDIITVLFGGETREDRLVRQIDEYSQKFANGAKNAYKSKTSNRLAK